MAKHDPTGRTKSTARFTMLPWLMTGSPAWLALSGAAVKVLVGLQRVDRGGDNGNLGFGARTASEATGLSRNTVMQALRELEEHGFIAATERGHFKVKGGPATAWRLTFTSAPSRSMPPTNEWQKWHGVSRGNKTRAQILTPTGAKSDMLPGNTATMGADIAPAMTETSHVSVSPAGSNIAPHIVCHRQGAEQGRVSLLKQANSESGLASETIGCDLLDPLRLAVSAYLGGAGVGAQTRLALAANMPGGTLSKFMAGRGLSRRHFIALQLALASAGKLKEAA